MHGKWGLPGKVMENEIFNIYHGKIMEFRKKSLKLTKNPLEYYFQRTYIFLFMNYLLFENLKKDEIGNFPFVSPK